MIEQISEVFQLDPKEKLVFSKIYELGGQPASVIARKLDIPRNSARFTLDNLVTIGLLIKTKSGNTQIYALESKENIVKTLKLSKNKIATEYEDKIQTIEKYGDQLHERFVSKKIPKIKFYEGEFGIEKVYDDTLNSTEEIKSWASFDGMHEGLPEYFKMYYKRRAGNDIHIKSIHPNTAFAVNRTKHDKTEKRTSKLVDSKAYNWVPEIQVYDNKVNIVSWKEKVGIIIESDEIAAALKTIFDMCWNNIK